MRKFIFRTRRNFPRLIVAPTRRLRRREQERVQKTSSSLEKWKFAIELIAITGAAIWGLIHFYYQEFEKPLSSPKPVTLDLKVEDGGVKDGTRALRVISVVKNVGDHTLYITPVVYELNGLRVYKVGSTGASSSNEKPLNRLSEKSEVRNDGYILRPKLILSSGTLNNSGMFLYPREEYTDSYIFHIRNDAYDAIHLAARLSSYEKKLADQLGVLLDQSSVLRQNTSTGSWEKLKSADAKDVEKKLKPDHIRHTHFVSLWNMSGYVARESIPNCVSSATFNEESFRRFVDKHGIPRVNVEKFSKLYPDLIPLIMTTASMDDDEKVEWLKIQAPKMTDSQVARLHEILRTERDKLDSLEELYAEEMKRLSAKGLFDDRPIVRDDRCD